MHKKEFKSIDQQINLLQERGLTINDVERAKKIFIVKQLLQHHQWI